MKTIISGNRWHLVVNSTFFVASTLLSLHTIAQDTPLIFPVPQNLEVADDSFIVDEKCVILVPERASEEDILLSRQLVRELSNRYGIALTIESHSRIPTDRKYILMGSVDNPFVKKYCEENRILLTKDKPGPEGYILNISNTSVVVGGSDNAELFTGFSHCGSCLKRKRAARFNVSRCETGRTCLSGRSGFMCQAPGT